MVVHANSHHTPTHHPTTHDVSILIALSRTSANPHLSNQIIREPRGYPYRLRSRVPSWGRHACPRSTQWVRRTAQYVSPVHPIRRLQWLPNLCLVYFYIVTFILFNGINYALVDTRELRQVE